MALIEVRHPDVEGTAFVPATSKLLQRGWVPVDSLESEPVDPPQEPAVAPTDPPTDVVGPTEATPAE